MVAPSDPLQGEVPRGPAVWRWLGIAAVLALLLYAAFARASVLA